LHLEWKRRVGHVLNILFTSHANLVEFAALPLLSSMLKFLAELNDTQIGLTAESARQSAIFEVTVRIQSTQFFKY
jgi:hypothetical protein